MKRITLFTSIIMLCIVSNSQTVKQDSATGNYYPVTKPKLLKMNVDERGLISCVLQEPNGEEKGWDYMTFKEFNELFGFDYTGNSYLTEDGKYPVYKTKTGKLFILKTSGKTGLVYKSYLKL